MRSHCRVLSKGQLKREASAVNHRASGLWISAKPGGDARTCVVATVPPSRPPGRSGRRCRWCAGQEDRIALPAKRGSTSQLSLAGQPPTGSPPRTRTARRDRPARYKREPRAITIMSRSHSRTSCLSSGTKAYVATRWAARQAVEHKARRFLGLSSGIRATGSRPS